jgi:hypothetical protein
VGVLGVAACLGLWSATARAIAPAPSPAASARAAVLLSAPASTPASLRLSPLDHDDEAVAGAAPEGVRKLNAELPISSLEAEPARPLRLAGGADRARAVECLATAIYYEAAFEPAAGQRAVAQVVLNRVRHPAFPKTVCGVIFDGADLPGCQFSFACDGSMARAPNPAAFRRARRIAEKALAGYVEPLVGTATFYHADYVAPYWRRRLEKIRQIGAHIFYRWPGAAGTRAAFVGRYGGHEPAPPARDLVPARLRTAQAASPGQAPADQAGRILVGRGWTPSVTAPAQAQSAYQRLMVEQQGAGGARAAGDGLS